MIPLIALAAKLLPLATAVPEVLRVFGGDKQADAAEKIVAVAKAVTGQSDPEKAVEAVQVDPTAQIEFQKALSSERQEFAKMELADRASARDREVKVVATESAPYLNKIITPLLAILVVGATFGMFWYMVESVDADINPSQKDIIIYVLGVLSAISTQVTAYYFGSSVGSTAKDQTIKRMLND